MEMVLLAAYAVPSINLFVPTYACFFCFCDYIARAGWSCIARLCHQVFITYWCKGKGDRVTNILDHLAIDEKCLWISFSLIFFKALLEGESQVTAENQNPCVFRFVRSREVKMILFDMWVSEILGAYCYYTFYLCEELRLYVHVFVCFKR